MPPKRGRRNGPAGVTSTRSSTGSPFAPDGPRLPRPTVQTTQRPLAEPRAGARPRAASGCRRSAISPGCLERLRGTSPAFAAARTRLSAACPATVTTAHEPQRRPRPPRKLPAATATVCTGALCATAKDRDSERAEHALGRATPAQARAARREPPRQAARSHQAV